VVHNDAYASLVQSFSFAWFRGPRKVFVSGGPGPGIMGEPSSWQPPRHTIIDVLKSSMRRRLRPGCHSAEMSGRTAASEISGAPAARTG
jgi:hypothetical protein